MPKSSVIKLNKPLILLFSVLTLLTFMTGVIVYYSFYYQSTTLTESDRYQTVEFKKGQTITIKLKSTYWESIDTFQDHNTVKPVGNIHYSPCAGEKGIGTGCGTTERSFIANSPGETRIYGSRTSCGEDRQCFKGEGSIALMIKVNP